MTFPAITRPVLLLRAGGLGDVILLRRAVARVRARGHSPWLWVPGRYGAALLGPGEADAVLDWDSSETARFLARPHEAPPVFGGRLADVASVVAFSRGPDLLEALTSLEVDCVSRRPEPPPGRHAADWYEGAVIEALGPGEPIPALGPCSSTPAENAEAEALVCRLPKGFLAIHPGSGSASKNWPLHHFLDVARILSPDRPWLLVQGPAEPRAGSIPDGVVAARGLGLRVLGTALAQSGLYIGNDSGVTHLAAAWGALTVALFGPTDPAVWAPCGPHVTVLRAPRGDLSLLSVADVARAARAM
jgi:ADP-heptose:LPS heptosyltransferase